MCDGSAAAVVLLDVIPAPLFVVIPAEAGIQDVRVRIIVQNGCPASLWRARCHRYSGRPVIQFHTSTLQSGSAFWKSLTPRLVT